MAALTPGTRIRHDKYGAGTIRFIHPPVLAREPAQCHVDFDGDKFPVGRRVWLADCTPEATLPKAPRVRAQPALRVIYP